MSSAPAANVASLFDPLQVGDVTLPNRIQMSAMTRNRAPNTVPSELMKEYYAQRARGGAGLIVTEGILVSRQGSEWEHAPGIWDEEQVQGWKKIVDAVHAEGSIIYAQLAHTGRTAHPDAPQQKLAGIPVYAPSAIASRGGKFRFIPGAPGYVTPIAIEDPRYLIELFRKAAVNAKAAGFDGVECELDFHGTSCTADQRSLHGASGHLIAQFLDSGSNQRTDQWGGSAENRARFPLETLKALKGVFGNNVAVKFTPAGGHNDMGMPLEETLETFRNVISEADKLGLSYIALTRYTPNQDPQYDGKPRATKHDILNSYRSYIKNSKFFFNGGISPEEGADLIKAGKINGLSIGLLWATHPDLAKRVKYGHALDNPPDIAALQLGRGSEDQWHFGYTDYATAATEA